MWTEDLNAVFEPLRQSGEGTGPEELYAELIREISGYHPSKDTNMIEKAYRTAQAAHVGQLRKSGEPYIIHPLCVAIILAKLKMDKETIEAALLHDVVEDTAMTKADVAREFGDDVALLVDGVTKLSRLPYDLDKEEVQAENLRKMFLAMARDIRVILIKLADRLHNMRTLEFQPPHKQARIARETLEIYAPLAARLGISKIKVELDDMSLRYLNPGVYASLEEELAKLKPAQDAFAGNTIREIRGYLEHNGVTARMYAHTKHIFGIYKKMVNKSRQAGELFGTFAICIIVGTVKDCYSTMGILHENYVPVYGRFKDYIAVPKQNMYRSLHTTLTDKSGQQFEVQIKTLEMLLVSEYGITVYWKYNQFDNGRITKSSAAEKMKWLQQILDWQKDLADNKTFLGTLKEDFNLLSEKISCFTPRGDVKTLPRGACAIDFAYSVHTSIGNTMAGARINGVDAPVTAVLQDGDIVQILTSADGAGPQMDWLKWVKTPQAKNKINEWVKSHIKQENIDKGRAAFESYCRNNGTDGKQILRSPSFGKVLEDMGYKNETALWLALSSGSAGAGQVLKRFFRLGNRELLPEKFKKSGEETIEVSDPRFMDYNLSVRYAKCCSPMPGDEIAGIYTRSHGISVHRCGCPNLKSAAANTPGQIVKIRWATQAGGGHKFPAQLDITVANRIGLIQDIARVLTDNRIEIENMNVQPKGDGKVAIRVAFPVADVQTLEDLLPQIRAVPDVITVERPSHTEFHKA